MDTSSSPWDTPTTETGGDGGGGGGGAGWADFDAFASSNNDSASSDIIEKQQSEVMNVEDKPEDDSSDGWRPSMASSPEATMLDCSQDDDKEENQDAVNQKLEDAKERLKVDSDDQSDNPDKKSDQGIKDAEESDETLEENFAFLSKRGMIAGAETSDKVSSSTDKSQK